jgi:hypothetical protein
MIDVDMVREVALSLPEVALLIAAWCCQAPRGLAQQLK